MSIRSSRTKEDSDSGPKPPVNLRRPSAFNTNLLGGLRRESAINPQASVSLKRQSQVNLKIVELKDENAPTPMTEANFGKPSDNDLKLSERQKRINNAFPKPAVYGLGDSAFSVPKYIPYQAPMSVKIRKMIDHHQYENIKRLVEVKGNECIYLQVPDQETTKNTPIYHNKAVLYLTPFAFAIYSGNVSAARFLVNLCKCDGTRVTNVNGVCYATNVCKRKGDYGDISITYPFCIAVCREVWDIIPDLIENGWKPHEPFKLPNRTAYTCINLNYTDYLDYVLGQLTTRPNLSIHLLMEPLYRTRHPNFELSKFEYAPKDEIPLNYCSIARRMLRYCRYIDKSLRTFSQILNAIRALSNRRFFQGAVHSIFAINIFERLKRLKLGHPFDVTDYVVFDQDGCIALFLGLIHLCVERALPNLEKKAIVILLKVLLNTHWIYHFFIYEGPVLLYYFRHIENVTCDLSVFKSIRDSIINYTKIDHNHAKSLLLDFNAGNLREMLNNMVERSKHLEQRERDFINGLITEEQLLSEAELVTQELFAEIDEEEEEEEPQAGPHARQKTPTGSLRADSGDEETEEESSAVIEDEQPSETSESKTEEDSHVSGSASGTASPSESAEKVGSKKGSSDDENDNNVSINDEKEDSDTISQETRVSDEMNEEKLKTPKKPGIFKKLFFCK